ncbi:N-methyl-L-tryptophan oxidase [Halorubrum sp. Atlit-26R]|uniref:N-methyl-L-tryptophan oxidase n=1 Tax=Halorubrum sp. Atlit-26R TaxID=2282128 RepID=UPI000EF1F215|nr:N-methyl-L-tryptophan oxidase [Halorubrum sp. Atlit-26R]RLM63660.1 N-methyl-L-tryptophan oxidase [Halorubrum sp. Atlit-26R]
MTQNAVHRYDVIIIGVGGMGSAATYHLADRGLDVLGLERYDIPHEMGSSHGVTRIIRKPQYEDPAYVPLIRRAYDLWRELEAETDRDLLNTTGGIDAGPPDSRVFAGSRESCITHDIDHQILDASEVNNRFPGYDLPANHRAVYQPDGGFLVPEQCIVAHVEAAQHAGATVRAREAAEKYETLPDGGVRVTTHKDTYEAEHLVITAGAWARKLLPSLEAVAVPERQVLAWLRPTAPERFHPNSFPVFVHDTGSGHYYGFPRYDVPGFKFGKFNHLEETVDPDTFSREPNSEDEQLLRQYAERFFPEGTGPTMRLATCMFTNTPDDHFILDTLPDQPQVTVGAGFSGHGFKFASVVGEVLADLAIDDRTDHHINLFGLDRFEEA